MFNSPLSRTIANSRVLTDAEIRTRAPSVFAESAHESRSERYLYVPTARIIEGLRSEGFMPTFAAQGRSRVEGKEAFTKHLVRFRHATDIEREPSDLLGKLSPEVVLINSHDGTSSYRIIAGLFRLICLNGLVTGESFDEVRVPHSHKQRDAVIEGTYRVIDESRRALTHAQQMSQIVLDRGERQAFAEAVHALRFDGSEGQAQAIRPERLIEPVRQTDAKPDLWTTFNVAQERAVRGGVAGVRVAADGAPRRIVRTRPVNNIDGQTALNRALWTLAERMAALKGQPIAQAA